MSHCWRSECRNGCYYPGVCSEAVATCQHGAPEGNCPSCAACAACDGGCGACPYADSLGWRCAHQWVDRPESDTRVCDLCGDEQ